MLRIGPNDHRVLHTQSEALGWEVSAAGLRRVGEQRRKLSTESDDVGHEIVAALHMTFGQGMTLSRPGTHIIDVQAQPEIPFRQVMIERQPMLQSAPSDQPHHCVMFPEFPSPQTG